MVDFIRHCPFPAKTCARSDLMASSPVYFPATTFRSHRFPIPLTPLTCISTLFEVLESLLRICTTIPDSFLVHNQKHGQYSLRDFHTPMRGAFVFMDVVLITMRGIG